MSGQNNLINLGDLAAPAKILIEKVSDAVGGIFKPYQIRRIAEAEAEAEKIKAISNIEINDLQQRAINRFMIEEATKQNNIESITRKAIPQLSEKANPVDMENDWVVNFFDKSRLISDEEMQNLWAKILAGEANKPGTYSKRTVHLVSQLDKEDAVLFNLLSSFIWKIGDTNTLVIFDVNEKIYQENKINFDKLMHLDAIGLISYEGVLGYIRTSFAESKVLTNYLGTEVAIEFPNDAKKDLQVGKAILTAAGEQLFGVCTPKKIDKFVEYVSEQWVKQGNIIKIKSQGM